MTSVRTIAALLACVSMSLQASACCLFPWFPSYSHGFGYGGGYGYAVPYSVGYYGSIDSCCNTCCQTSCCPTGTCQGSCGSNCGATEVRKEAVPDPISNERNNETGGSKTFGGTGADDQYNDNVGGGSSGSGRGVTGDDFGKGSGNENGAPPNWSPSGSDDRGTGGTRAPFGGEDDIPGLGGFGSSKKPVTGDETDGGIGTGSDTVIDHSANKAPITMPLDENATDDTPGADNTTPPGSGTDAESDPGTNVDPTEFLGPGKTNAKLRTDDQIISRRDSRSSHFGVLGTSRLAGNATQRGSSNAMISTSQKKQTPVRWISLPMPVGQERG